MAMNKAVIYVRVSTKDQERGYSISSQLRLLRDYAGKTHLRAVKEFRETESAGKAGRTAFGQMVQLLRSDRSITEILVEKTDRLYRNFKDHVLIDDLGINIHFVKDSRVLGKDAKSADKFVNDIQTAQARFYSNNLSDEVKKGQRQKAREGKFPRGMPPLGYIRNGVSRAIEIDPDRAPLIKILFEYYAEGDKSLDQAHGVARKIGLTYRKSGRTLARSGVERLLKNVFYTGKFKWNGTVHQGDHPQIVTDSLFERVQETFQARSNGKTGAKSFVFGRLMRCSQCGHTVTAEIKKKRYIYYHCTGYGTNHKVEYIPENVLDEQFADFIGAVTIPDEFYNYLKTCLDSEIRNTRTTLETEKRQLELSSDKIQSDMKRTLQKNLDGKISDELLGKMQNDLQMKLTAVNYRLDNLSKVKSEEFDRAAKTIELSHQAETLYFKANPEQKRKLIKSTLSNCNLSGRTLCVTYRKPFDLFAEGIKFDNWRRE
ncbi:MAG: recombinase family protein [candidate division Zixibacteria bacterium]|nr:recombinase family protein [candidate division Zixibacteria bacterium]